MLVSNVLQDVFEVGTRRMDADYAQGFTSGSNPWGYTLTSIDVRLQDLHAPFGTATLYARTARRVRWLRRLRYRRAY